MGYGLWDMDQMVYRHFVAFGHFKQKANSCNQIHRA